MPPKKRARAEEAKAADPVDPVAQARRGDPWDGERISDMQSLPKGEYVSTLMVARKEDPVDIGAPGFQFTGVNLTSGVTHAFVCDTALSDRQYNTTAAKRVQPVTRSELIAILEAARDCVVRVVFHKKVNPAEQERLLEGAALETRAQRIALVKRILTGERRELKGIVFDSNREWGRTIMLDLDAFFANKDAGIKPAERQVDHRSLVEVTCKNVCYTCPMR